MSEVELSKLTQRDLSLFAKAMSCLKSGELLIDNDKFAEMAGFKNANSARVAWHNLKKKIMAPLEGDAPITPASGKKRKSPSDDGDDNEAKPSAKKARKPAAKKTAKAAVADDEIDTDEAVKAEASDDDNDAPIMTGRDVPAASEAAATDAIDATPSKKATARKSTGGKVPRKPAAKKTAKVAAGEETGEADVETAANTKKPRKPAAKKAAKVEPENDDEEAAEVADAPATTEASAALDLSKIMEAAKAAADANGPDFTDTMAARRASKAARKPAAAEKIDEKVDAESEPKETTGAEPETDGEQSDEQKKRASMTAEEIGQEAIEKLIKAEEAEEEV